MNCARFCNSQRQVGARNESSSIRLWPAGLSYYTGAIMEINVADLAGSLGGGGRYDNLVGMFLGKDIPACGFSLGLERIIVVMSEREMFPPQLVSSPADVMVTIWNEESIGESIALATELRSKGLRVDVYPEADKLGKQFKYASSRGIPFVAIVGDDERARGEVAIKDMRSGDQRSVKREDKLRVLSEKLGNPGCGFAAANGGKPSAYREASNKASRLRQDAVGSAKPPECRMKRFR